MQITSNQTCFKKIPSSAFKSSVCSFVYLFGYVPSSLVVCLGLAVVCLIVCLFVYVFIKSSTSCHSFLTFVCH